MKSKFTQILSSDQSRISSLLTKTWVHCLFIALTAGLVRISLLESEYPLSFDDGVYAISIAHIERGLQPFDEVFSSQGPYFLTLISIPAQIFGTTPITVRLISFISGLLLAVLSYFVAKKFMCTKWAFIVGMLVAVSGSILRTTTPITSDGIVAVFVLLSVLATYRFLDKQDLYNAFLLGAAIGIGCGIKNVFMIPAIFFVLVATCKTSFKLRLFAGFISLVFFFAPYFYFGFEDTLEQSIFYHLGKNVKFDIADNITKLFTTFSSFDIYLLVLVPIALAIGLKKFLSAVKNDKSFKSLIFKFLDPRLPYLFILTLCVGNIVLVMLQTPLFRNHLTIIVAPLIITVIYLLQTMKLRNPYYELGVTIIVCILVVMSIINVYNDPLIKPSSDLRNATAVLKTIPPNKIILTNEPGIAFASGLDVPVGLEDTSRFRFLNSNDKLKITRDDFEEILKSDRRICAFVVSPLPISKEVELNKIAPKNWEKAFDSGYQIWINPSSDCRK